MGTRVPGLGLESDSSPVYLRLGLEYRTIGLGLVLNLEHAGLGLRLMCVMGLGNANMQRQKVTELQNEHRR